LLDVLHRLRDHGNTLVVIEHNLDVIKTADWIVDIGPEGGSGGGQIIATGTPEQAAEAPRSHTGKFLGPLLERDRKSGPATPLAGMEPGTPLSALPSLGTSSTSLMSGLTGSRAASCSVADELVLDEMVSSLSLYGVVMRQRK